MLFAFATTTLITYKSFFIGTWLAKNSNCMIVVQAFWKTSHRQGEKFEYMSSGRQAEMWVCFQLVLFCLTYWLVIRCSHESHVVVQSLYECAIFHLVNKLFVVTDENWGTTKDYWRICAITTVIPVFKLAC